MQPNGISKHLTDARPFGKESKVTNEDKKMRSILILIALITGTAQAASDYEETRDLTLESEGIGVLDIESRAGSLKVVGRSDSDEITVTAIARVPGRSDDDAQEIIESDLVLSLKRKGDTAVRKGYFESSGWNFRVRPSVHLEVHVPQALSLVIEDGSGSISIDDVAGDIDLEDGSGSIEMGHVGGDVRIEDGSGSISVRDVGADLSIVDGSGSITVERVSGSVIVDDGSGNINVSDVDKDLILRDDGSGSLKFSGVVGRVEIDD